MVETSDLPPPKSDAPVLAPSPGNPSITSPSLEEGELSSGEDAELPPSTAAFNNKPLFQPILVSRKKLVRNPQTGNSSSMANTMFHTSSKRYYRNSFMTKQVPFKSSNNRTLTWHKKTSNDNLVIRFSDDDSETDYGHLKSNATTEKKANEPKPIKCKMPMMTAQGQQELFQQSKHHGTKLVHKKGVVGHGSLSDEKNGYNFGHCRTSSIEKAAHIQKQFTALKTSINQVGGQIRDTGLADSAVESLRHQIAVRENKLKVQMKSIYQNQDKVTGSDSHNFEGLSQKLVNQITDIDGAAANMRGTAVDTRPTKRLKLDETSEFSQSFDEPLEEHSSKRMVEAHVLRKEECSSLVARSALDYDRIGKNITLSMINEGTDKKHQHTGLKDDETIVHSCTAASPSYNTVNDKRHDQVNENVPSSSKVLQKGLEDDDILLASSDTASPYLGSAINYTEEANNNVKESVLLTSASLDQSLNLALFLQDAKSSLTKGGSGADFVSLKCPIEKQSVNGLEDKLPDAEIDISEDVIMNLESLLELEELRDKELDEAQEVRRRCELDERHALKAYRKAQRALINANERCAILQRNREMVSAKLQTLILGSSNSMQPYNEPNHGDSLQYTTLSFGMSGKGRTQEHLANKSKGQFLDGTLDGSYIQMNRHASSSNQYSEPDNSASDHRDKNAVNGVSSPASIPYLTTDEDQDNLPQDNQCVDSNLVCPTKVGNHKEKNNDMNVNKEDNSQDYDLEASLRSKLVARFSVRASCKNADMNNVECQVDLTASTADMKSDTPLDQQLQVQKNICESNPKGLAVAGGIINRTSVEQCEQSQLNKFSLKDEVRMGVDSEENSSLLKESSFSSCPLIMSLPSAVLHNVLPLLKVKVPAYDTGVSYGERKGSRPMDKSHEFAFYMQSFNEYARGSYDNSIITCEMGYSTCDLSIDPFWPFCMYELRGKCNDDECPWQHDNKTINRKITRDGCIISYNSDVNIDALTGKISFADLERTHGLGKPFLPVPAYYIGSSLIKADSHFCHSLLARDIWQYWQRGFSASFPLPFSIQRILPQDAPFLQISDGNVADYDSWSRHSWYLEIQDDKRKKDIQGSLDSEHSLELALKFFRGNFNKSDKKKALSLLSRAIEVDPTSIVVWIVYLHIFYMKERGIGKDDMFLHAVQHNRSSYELWLMFINSRVKLNDRLNAYNDALSILCRGKLTSDKEKKNRSAYVLDIFLQMVDCLCMCGSVEEAVGRIYQLVSTLESEVSGDSLLAEILSILTVPDQCIFWMCCMYLVVYRKLPKEIVQDFESQKDLPFSLEWPSVQLTTEESDQIAELIKFFLEKVAIGVGDNHVSGDITALRSMHFIAVSHVRLVTALNGFDHSSELLVKYRKLYPTCIELVLLSVRSQANCSNEEFFRLFEEVRHEWPREVPGIQCIWNQFIEHALVKGADCAEKLIEQWFQQFGELNESRFRNLDGNDASLCESSKQALLIESADSSQTYLDDKTFGLINLSVHKMLKNDVEGACNAVDEALKLVSPKCYSHVIKEHAAIFLLKGSKSPENTHSQGIFRLLNNYLHDPRFLPRRELLSRQYYQNVKKLRLRKLIDEIIGSVSVDFSQLNSVLDVSFDQMFLPDKVEPLPKCLVDLVELLMELTPANYQLALSVHKFCARSLGGSVDASCAGIMLWASSLLVNSIFQAVPVAPESLWLEAADLLGHSIGRVMAERFHQQALSVYPFSLKLWKSYLYLTKMTGNADAVIEAAQERGFELNISPE